MFPPIEERLSLEELIKGYTITPAKALRLDDKIGSIESGKDADLVILNEDLFNMDAYSIHNIVPAAVMLVGKVVKGAL